MLEDFLEWVNEQLAQHGLSGVLYATVGIIGAAGALSGIFGSVIIVAAVGTSIVFVFLVFLLAVIRGETKALESARKANSLLYRYSYLVEELSPAQLCVDDWAQEVALDSRGNAKVNRKITLTPEGGSLHFLWLRLSCDSRTSPRIRHGVVAVARQVEGARHQVTCFWKDDRTHEVLVHFEQPIEQGTQISVEVDWKWPLYSSGLMAGGFENFYISFAHRVRRATHTVVLPVGSNGPLPSVSAYYLAKYTREQVGSLCRVTFEVKDCKRDTRYSVTIDRRPGSRG